MKRLLIALILVITSFSIFAITQRSGKNASCTKQHICCNKKQVAPSDKDAKTDYIFWQPMNRLMMINR